MRLAVDFPRLLSSIFRFSAFMNVFCPAAMRRRFFPALLAAALLIAGGGGCAASGASQEATTRSNASDAGGNDSERPNIVIIMADDMGFSDAGSYGGEIDTPNIDRLAARGLRFTQFYNTSRCVPTRASLLTGQYAHKAGVGRMTRDQGEPGYRGHLNEQNVTIAELLKQEGYQTGMVGKWHLALTQERDQHLKWLAHQKQYDQFAPLDQYPTAYGFDDYYGNIWGVVNYFDPFSLTSGTEPVRSVPSGYYHTDAISDTAVAYAQRYSQSEDPFFLYVAHTAPHWPLHAPEEAVDEYEGVYDEGWQPVREARYERQLDMGLFTEEEAPLSDRQPAPQWEGNEDAGWYARAMAVHAAMIDRMDAGIGRLLDELEAQGELENTLILFLSDNGASPEYPSEYGPGFDRPGETRGGQTIRYDTTREVLPGPETTFAGIGPTWANASNTPFRYWKRRVYEGGITTPLIAHWPEGMQAEPGTITEQPGHVIDLMATVLDVTGAEYPERFDGEDLRALDGLSLMPILQGQERAGHDALYWEHFGSSAIRSGKWKLVRFGTDTDWKLFNLATNRTETNDLSGAYPERVKRMTRQWQRWAEETNVFPRPQ